MPTLALLFLGIQAVARQREAIAGLSVTNARLQEAAGPSMRPPQKHRGVNYAHAWRSSEQLGYGSPASAQSIERLRSVHVNWIALTPFGFQQTSRDATIRWAGARFSESDARLRAATEQAHARGIQVNVAIPCNA